MDSIENIKNELDNKIETALNAISEIDFTKLMKKTYFEFEIKYQSSN